MVLSSGLYRQGRHCGNPEAPFWNAVVSVKQNILHKDFPNIPHRHTLSGSKVQLLKFLNLIF